MTPGGRVDRSIGPIVELNCWQCVVPQSHWVVGEHLQQAVDKLLLASYQFDPGDLRGEPTGSVDLWKRLQSTRSSGPLELERVTDDASRVEVRLCCPCRHQLPAGLADAAQVAVYDQGRRRAQLFLELPLRGKERILTGLVLTLRDRPCAIVFVRPEGAAHVRKQHFQDDLVVLVDATVEQQTGAQLVRHESSMPVDVVTRASHEIAVRRPSCACFASVREPVGGVPGPRSLTEQVGTPTVQM